MDNTLIHRINFFEQKPMAIRRLAYEESSSQLAVSRSDSSIEIWNVKNKAFLLTTIPKHPSHSIEALSWCNGRLFAGDLQGHIIEHDVMSLKRKNVTSVPTNSSVWCLGVNTARTMIAAGTEDGHVCLFNILSSGLELNKIFTKLEDRMLCLDWHESSEFVITGSIDRIFVWDVNTGKVKERIRVGRSEKGAETVVWCIAVTRDMTIISGDSRGKTCFWDGKNGTLIASSAVHKADVLTLCLNKDESVVYAAGIDTIISMYERTRTQPGGQEWNRKWVKSGRRSVHTHDVLALQFIGEYLVSAGIDTKLVFSKYPPKFTVSHSPYPKFSYISTASDASLVMFRYQRHLEVWRLQQNLDPAALNCAVLKSKTKGHINSSAISRDGKWIAYSASQKLKLFHITIDDVPVPIIQEVRTLPEERRGCCLVAFLANGKLVFSSMDGKIHLLECDLLQPKLVWSLDSEFEYIHMLTVSPDDNVLAVTSYSGKISLFDLNTRQVHSHLPFYECPVNAMKFNDKSEDLLVAYSDRKVVEYNLEKKAYSDWCRRQCFSKFQDHSPYPVRGIAFVPCNQDKIVMYDDQWLYVIDKLSTTEANHDPKRAKVAGDIPQEITDFKIIDKYTHILDFCSLNSDEMILVEIKPADVYDTLPPPLYRKKYGT